MKAIQKRRGKIDRIDSKLVRLLNQRTRLAIEIARLKHRAGLARYSRAREVEILAQARRSNAGPLAAPSVLRLFRQILRETRRAQNLGLPARSAEERRR